MPRIIALDAWCDPERVFAELCSARERHSFWLDAGADAEHGRSWMGAPSSPDDVALFGPDDDVFGFLRSGLAAGSGRRRRMPASCRGGRRAGRRGLGATVVRSAGSAGSATRWERGRRACRCRSRGIRMPPSSSSTGRSSSTTARARCGSSRSRRRPTAPTSQPGWMRVRGRRRGRRPRRAGGAGGRPPEAGAHGGATAPQRTNSSSSSASRPSAEATPTSCASPTRITVDGRFDAARHLRPAARREPHTPRRPAAFR